MAASSDCFTEIPEKKARLTHPVTPDEIKNDATESAEDQQPHSSKQVNNDTDDNVSEISNLSGLEEESQEARWRPNRGPLAWVQFQMLSGTDPRTILKDLIPSNMSIPDEVDEMTLWRIIVSILSEPPRRKKLKHINTVDDAVNLIRSSKKIMVLTGAGISVSCGIPDFRSKDGIYAKLAVEYPDLSEPQDMFDIGFFSKNPKPFFKFASEIYPGKFSPSVSHRFIRHLEDSHKLLRNYTQNIDTLEQCAGIKNVIQCHGSFATASCMACKHKVNSDDIKDDIMKQQIPRCPRCPPEEERGIMKPDIVFFGEGLPDEFHKQMELDKDQCDLLIVIGSSLKVRPVALIPNSLPATTPQILINREPLRHMTFDIELLGNCDVVIETLARRLGWSELFGDVELQEVGPEHVVDDVSNAETAGSGQIAREGSNDDSTCDSVTENMQECHLCLSGAFGCTHQESKPKETEETPPSNEKSAESASGQENAVPTTERVSHDVDLSGVSSHQPEERVSLAQKLPEGTYAFLPPNKYLFSGGELMNYNPNADSDDESSSSADSDDDSPEEITKHEEMRSETETKNGSEEIKNESETEHASP